MRLWPLLLAVLPVFARPAHATIIVGMPTGDGFVVCADRLLAAFGDRKEDSMVTKLHRRPPNLIWATGGNVLFVQMRTGEKAFDVEAIVRTFLSDHPEEPGTEFFRALDSFVWSEYQKKLKLHSADPPPTTFLRWDVVFFWAEKNGFVHVHLCRLANGTPAAPLDFRQTRPIDRTTTVNPLVFGIGHEVLGAVVDGDQRYDRFRQDAELMNILGGTTPVHTIGIRKATRLLKRLVVTASRAERVLRAEHTISEESDCLSFGR
jgi:hypothetical protein